jgi:GDP-L-fucose synthase
MAAGKVGGIGANIASPEDFLYENAQLSCNVIRAAARTGVQKLLYLGSSCIYPQNAPQPMKEESLLTGPLEATSEAYALGKLIGLKLCEAYQKHQGKRFISAIPANLYGPGERYDAEKSHVVPALLGKFHEAKRAGSPCVRIWGSGTAKREFLYVDDLAEALVLLMNSYEGPGPVNVGTGREHTILELAALVREVVGYEGDIQTDPSKPDGVARKALDSSRITALGWRARTSLKEGLIQTDRRDRWPGRAMLPAACESGS